MYFQLINSSDTEAVFAQCKNAATTALAIGSAVIWAYNGTSDGLAVAYPTSTKATLLAGVIAEQSLAVGGLGRVQIYGHNANALVSGSTDVTLGCHLYGKRTTVNLVKYTTAVAAPISPMIVAGQAYTTTAAAAKKVFIRCM